MEPLPTVEVLEAMHGPGAQRDAMETAMTLLLDIWALLHKVSARPYPGPRPLGLVEAEMRVHLEYLMALPMARQIAVLRDPGVFLDEVRESRAVWHTRPGARGGAEGMHFPPALADRSVATATARQRPQDVPDLTGRIPQDVPATGVEAATRHGDPSELALSVLRSRDRMDALLRGAYGRMALPPDAPPGIVFKNGFLQAPGVYVHAYKADGPEWDCPDLRCGNKVFFRSWKCKVCHARQPASWWPYLGPKMAECPRCGQDVPSDGSICRCGATRRMAIRRALQATGRDDLVTQVNYMVGIAGYQQDWREHNRQFGAHLNDIRAHPDLYLADWLALNDPREEAGWHARRDRFGPEDAPGTSVGPPYRTVEGQWAARRHRAGHQAWGQGMERQVLLDFVCHSGPPSQVSDRAASGQAVTPPGTRVAMARGGPGHGGTPRRAPWRPSRLTPTGATGAPREGAWISPSDTDRPVAVVAPVRTRRGPARAWAPSPRWPQPMAVRGTSPSRRSPEMVMVPLVTRP